MRKLKNQIVQFLKQENFSENLTKIHEYPVQKTINILFSLLCSTNNIVKNNAIIAMGEIVEKNADTDLDFARAIMRRLTWSLNEESGWIGWGSAEAMGEIMARNEKMANEYHKFLISYISEGENYLLFDELRKEVILGLRRLQQVRPDLVKEVSYQLSPEEIEI